MIFQPPGEPDYFRIAFRIAGAEPLTAQQIKRTFRRILEMQAVPALHFDPPESLILALELFIRLAPGLWVFETKARTVFWRPSLAAVRQRWAIECAMRFDPHQQIAFNLGRAIKESSAPIFTVVEGERTLGQQRHNRLELLGRLLTGGELALDPLVQQGQKPTPFVFRDYSQGAEPVTDGDRRLQDNRRRLMLNRDILQRLRVEARPSRMVTDQHR